MKDFGCYKHVLFEDLKHYLKRSDYLSGYTAVELAFIRKNIGAIGESDIEHFISKILKDVNELSYEDFAVLLYLKKLVPGCIYIINNFLTIYLTNHIYNNKFVSYGLENHPSETYKLVCLAVSEDLIIPLINIIHNRKILPWIVLYNPYYKVLDDGTKDKGRIFLLEDEFGNRANYDFKNILFDLNDLDFHTFSDANGNDNSLNCSNNDLRLTYGNIIKTTINNLVCRYDGIIIDNFHEQDLSTKQIIKRDDNYFIDYLDIETLTHLFYAIAKNKNFG